MKTPPSLTHESYPDTHHDIYSKTIFGFWVYLLTDFILFATFFATYAVLRHGTAGGPSDRELFDLSLGLNQSLLLLTASLTSGIGGAHLHRKDKRKTLLFFGITLLLGILFMWIEIDQFNRLIQSGNSWQRSAFLSMFFTLVGTHGIHILFAILWTIVLSIPFYREEEITPESMRRFTCLRMFWQFLNVIWVFIFAVVYFMGGI